MSAGPDIPMPRGPRWYMMRPFMNRGYALVVDPRRNPWDYHLSDADADIIRDWIPTFDPDNADIPSLEALFLTKFRIPPADTHQLTWPQIVAILRDPNSRAMPLRAEIHQEEAPSLPSGGAADVAREAAIREFRSLAGRFEGMARKFGGRSWAKADAVAAIQSDAEAGVLLVDCARRGWLPMVPGLEELLAWLDDRSSGQDHGRAVALVRCPANVFSELVGGARAEVRNDGGKLTLTSDPKGGLLPEMFPSLFPPVCYLRASAGASGTEANELLRLDELSRYERRAKACHILADLLTSRRSEDRTQASEHADDSLRRKGPNVTRNKRKSLPPDDEATVLEKCRRRCCVCFMLDHDASEKKGQLAHLDHNPANNAIDNFVWLCLSHHDTYDSRTSQAKNLTESEVRRYQAKLHQAVEDGEVPSRQGATVLKFPTQQAASVNVNGDGNVVAGGDVNYVVNMPRPKRGKGRSATRPPIIPGTVSEDPRMVGYLNYLVRRYEQFKKWDCDQSGERMGWGAIRKFYKRDMKYELIHTPKTLFEAGALYLQQRIEKTQLGRIKRGQKLYSAFTDFDGQTANDPLPA